MFVDDDEDDNYFHKIVIEKLNIVTQVAIVVNGFEALDFLKNQNQPKPDLIFLDINMPKMTGWQFLEEHSKLSEAQKAKVIIVMLSATKDQDDIKRVAKFAETIDFNYKPLTEKALIKILEQYFPENGSKQ